MSKLYFLFILIFIFPRVALSQSNIFFGIKAAPGLTFPETARSIPDLNEKLNYSAGLSGLFFLSNEIFIKSGINYTRKSFSLAGIPDTRGALINREGIIVYDINDPSAHIDPSRIKWLEITQAYHSVTIPVILNYKFSDEGSSFFASAGFEAAFLYNMKGSVTSEGEEETWNEKLHYWAPSISAGFGWYNPISEKFLLIVTPEYSYDFYPDWNKLDFNFQTISLSVECYFR